MKSLFRLNRSLLLLPVCAAAVVTVAGCSMETELLLPEGAFTPENSAAIPSNNVSPAPGIGIQGPADSASIGGTTTVDDVLDMQPVSVPAAKEPVKDSVKTPDAPVRRPAVSKTVAGEVYKVKKGDTLGSIAKRYKTNWRALAEYNGLDGKARIFVGQTIRIPVTAASASPANAPAKTATAKPAADSGKIHVVKKGEFPGKIAAMYKVKVADLLALNNLTVKSTIRVGQKLRIPNASAAPAKNVKKDAAKKPAAKKATKKVTKQPAKKADKNVRKSDNIPVVDEQKQQKTTGDDVLNDFDGKENTATSKTTVAVSASTNVAVATPAAEKEAAKDSHTLSLTLDKDMTLEQAAKAFDRSVESLKKCNPSLNDGDVIKAGTTLAVPIF